MIASSLIFQKHLKLSNHFVNYCKTSPGTRDQKNSSRRKNKPIMDSEKLQHSQTLICKIQNIEKKFHATPSHNFSQFRWAKFHWSNVFVELLNFPGQDQTQKCFLYYSHSNVKYSTLWKKNNLLSLFNEITTPTNINFVHHTDFFIRKVWKSWFEQKEKRLSKGGNKQTDSSANSILPFVWNRHIIWPPILWDTN